MEHALRSIPDELDDLATAERLARALGPELGRRAAELRELRFRSRGRFEGGVLPFLTRKGLEQATPWVVARQRAGRFVELLGPSQVWDATCGIGSDLLALRAEGLQVVASDLDAHTLTHARENLRRAGGGASFLVADAAHPPLTSRAAAAVLLDPDRRRGGKRVGNPRDWGPPLSACLRVARSFQAACLKLPPGMDPAGLPPEGHLSWTSLGGQLRELTLWLGTLAGSDRMREALALDGRGGVARMTGTPLEVGALAPDDARRIEWLAEPDPAVIRAGLVGRLAAEQGLAPLGPGLAYLGGERRPASPLLRAWRVLGTAPLDRKRVRSLLGEHDVGALTVKKRGHPDPAQVLAARLAGPGSRPGLLAVARLARGHLALLLEASATHRGG